MLHGRDGVRWVMNCSQFPPGVALCIQLKEFNLCLIRSNNILPHAFRVFLVPFCNLQACCQVAFSQEWLPPGQSPTKLRFLKCWRDCRPSGRFSLLSQETLSFCQSGLWVLGHLPIQGPSCPVVQFGQTASSRKSLGSSIFFPFPNDRAHCALENFQHSQNCFIPILRCIPTNNSISEFLWLHGGVSALTCNDNYWTWYTRVCFLLHHVQSINLATGGLQSSSGDISRMLKGNWMHLSSIWSVMAKGLNTYWLKTVQHFIYL